MRYSILPAMFVPTGLSVIAIAASVASSGWFIASIPFVWLGAVCAAPNLNLADGCLAYAATILGAIISIFFKPLGEAILFGTICGYFLSAIEKYLRMRPISNEDKDGNSVNQS